MQTIRTAHLAVLYLASLLGGLFAGAAIATAAAADQPAQERYFIVELDGQKVGWAVERTVMGDAGGRATSGEMSFSIARGPIIVSFGIATQFVENAAGDPHSMRSEMRQGEQVTIEEYVWSPDGTQVRHTTETAGGRRTERVAAPRSPWLTPGEVEALTHTKLDEGAERFAFATLDPSNGLKPVLTKVEVLGKEQIEVQGKPHTALKLRTTTSVMPGVAMTSFVDEQGETLLTDLPLGGLRLTIRAATKPDALARFEAPELMVATLLKPDVPIERPRFVDRAVYRLEGIHAQLPDLPVTGAQTAEPAGANALRLTVDVHARPPAKVTAAQRKACLARTTMADPADPQIAALTAHALRGKENAPAHEQAETLRAFVASHITEKSLDVGFATASDVVRTREGDCTEHGVLLVAMLRRANIPARAVSGLVYIDEFLGEEGVFGYHMWAQALLPIDPDNPDAGETWVDLDAAIATRPFDATHITLSTTDLEDGGLAASMAIVARALGNIRVTVEAIEHADAPANVR